MSPFRLNICGDAGVKVVAIGCAYLPQLLGRSSLSSELITFLRGGQFERICADYLEFKFSYDKVLYNFKMEELIPNVMKAIQSYLEVSGSST